MTPDAQRRLTPARLLAWADRYRIFLLLAAVFAAMAAGAPNFLRVLNLTSIMSVVAMNACVGIGFTLVMICGQLDLSIGTVITLAGVVGLGLKARYGYEVSVPVALAVGAGVGLVNGLLVTKARVNSFIVTLGTMTVLQGAIYQVTGGNTVAVSDRGAFAVADWLGKPWLPLVTPRVLVTLVLVALAEVVLRRTRAGRNLYMVGGNRQAAWLAGIATDRYLIAAFVLSGVTAAVGGVLFAMEQAAATLRLGDNSLMYVIAATIIGGTAMSGGRGSVVRTFVAILTLEVLFNGVVLLGLGNEVKILLAGGILAAVVLSEAYAAYRHERVVGQRPELLRELAARRGAPGT